LKSLMKLAPKTATIVKDGKEETVPISQVKKGSIFAVKSGESIPVDGIILDGSAAIDESALTGESIPVDKSAGDTVSAATISKSGYIRCEATRVGEDTTLSQIIKMVGDAAATKAPIAKIADKVSGIFVPAVITIAIITTIIWLLVGESFGFALARGISVLVISCPCALGLATPVAIMVGSGVGAKNGILFKTAVSLEETGRVSIIALDKTGTITKGEPKVTDIIPEGISEKELLTLAYSVEIKSEHPLAKAIVHKAEETDISAYETTDFTNFAGNGLQAQAGNDIITGGSLKFISEAAEITEAIRKKAAQLADSGKTPMLFAKNGKALGIIAVADVIKEDSPQAIKELQNMGIRVVMLTGDNEKTAKAIGKAAGVDEVIAGVLPGGKEAVIRSLQKQGKVAMVGDGINDAPALTSADIGIAIGAGADIAIDAADIVLMKSRLTDVAAAIRLSRATLRNIHQNLFWAFIYNIIGIPLAAGAFISILGWKLNPMFGAAAMSLSSFCVVSNALRLNLSKIYSSKHDKRIKSKIKEKKSMEKSMKIEGMMCPHCEARVKKVLEGLPEVESADVSHENDSAVVTLIAPLSDDALKAAIEEQGYTVIEIK
ncbi:MAG: metal-transporting ATPase, partial [Clostridia bacterium]|nr:metal-transporting ATPase [Clostridia bacterium]